MKPLTVISGAVVAVCLYALGPAVDHEYAQAHLAYQPPAKTVKLTRAQVHARQSRNLRHANYVCERGHGPKVKWHCQAISWLEREHAQTKPRPLATQAAICLVFGDACHAALAVARCESNFNIYAANGQYLGLYQMGSYARGRYGHAYTALGQARAAYQYYRDAGWHPWACAHIVGIL